MTDKCLHHYILEPPNGVNCLGVCKKCGATKIHSNELGKKVVARETRRGYMQKVVEFSLNNKGTLKEKNDADVR